MKHKAYYPKPDGNFFLARNDDETRAAYAAMGFKMTDRNIVPAIVMTPRIERPLDEKRPVVIPVSRHLGGLDVVQMIDALIGSDPWNGSVAELAKALELEIDSRTVGVYLGKQVIKDALTSMGLCLSKRRTEFKRLLVISRCS